MATGNLTVARKMVLWAAKKNDMDLADVKEKLATASDQIMKVS